MILKKEDGLHNPASQNIPGTVTQTTPFKYRYSLSYCTVNYTMSFYQKKEWEYVLDWLALNGVNLALATVDTEKIWDLTLRDLGFSKAERQAFIPPDLLTPHGGLWETSKAGEAP